MDAVETIEHRGYSIGIYHDEDAGNPLTESDCQPTLVLHRQAERHFGWTTDKNWGAKVNAALDAVAERGTTDHLYGPGGALEVVSRWLTAFQKVPLVLPVSAYEHSGVSVSLGTDNHWSDPGGWDSGWIGWLFITHDQVKSWGTPPDRIEDALRGGFEEFAAWVAGDCYGYRILSPDGDEIESCWGFYGWDIFDENADTITECKSIIDDAIAAGEDPADPPHLASWRPCKWQTHAGTIAPMWDTDPHGPSGWTGWCGVPTDDASGLCAEHQSQLAAAQ